MNPKYLLVVAALVATHSGAQYPAKPVRVVVPYAAGGLPDTMTRLVATRLTETLKQQFVIDNRPGAGGIGACELVARANAEETDRLGALAAAGTPADADYMQKFSARVLVETAYGAKWCAEAIEILQRNSGSTAIMLFEPIQRAWRDARIITLHGALNLEALAENYGRLMAGIAPHNFEGITTLDRFAPTKPAQQVA